MSLEAVAVADADGAGAPAASPTETGSSSQQFRSDLELDTDARLETYFFSGSTSGADIQGPNAACTGTNPTLEVPSAIELATASCWQKTVSSGIELQGYRDTLSRCAWRHPDVEMHTTLQRPCVFKDPGDELKTPLDWIRVIEKSAQGDIDKTRIVFDAGALTRFQHVIPVGDAAGSVKTLGIVHSAGQSIDCGEEQDLIFEAWTLLARNIDIVKYLVAEMISVDPSTLAGCSTGVDALHNAQKGFYEAIEAILTPAQAVRTQSLNYKVLFLKGPKTTEDDIPIPSAGGAYASTGHIPPAPDFNPVAAASSPNGTGAQLLNDTLFVIQIVDGTTVWWNRRVVQYVDARALDTVAGRRDRVCLVSRTAAMLLHELIHCIGVPSWPGEPMHGIATIFPDESAPYDDDTSFPGVKQDGKATCSVNYLVADAFMDFFQQRCPSLQKSPRCQDDEGDFNFEFGRVTLGGNIDANIDFTTLYLPCNLAIEGVRYGSVEDAPGPSWPREL